MNHSQRSRIFFSSALCLHFQVSIFFLLRSEIIFFNVHPWTAIWRVFWHKETSHHGSIQTQLALLEVDELSSSWVSLLVNLAITHKLHRIWLRFSADDIEARFYSSSDAIEFQSWSVAYGIKMFYYFRVCRRLFAAQCCCPLMAISDDDVRWKIAKPIRFPLIVSFKNQWLSGGRQRIKKWRTIGWRRWWSEEAFFF